MIVTDESESDLAKVSLKEISAQHSIVIRVEKGKQTYSFGLNLELTYISLKTRAIRLIQKKPRFLSQYTERKVLCPLLNKI